MAVLYEEDLPVLMAEINKRINEKVGKEYTFYIDQSISDPAGVISWSEVYDQSTPAAWMTELGIKPCIVRNGTVVGYLNPNNYAYMEDGSKAPITTAGNDVMIEIPRMGIRCVKLSNTKACVTITKRPNATGFDYRAFSYETYNDSSKLYVGAYDAWSDGTKLYSISGKKPTTNLSLSSFRAKAKARGEGYSDITYSVVTLLQCIYCLVFRNTNSQSVVGRGYTLDSHTDSIVTGGGNAYGMNSEQCTGTVQTDFNHHVKFCGLESFWGNVFTLEDGMIIDSAKNVKVASTVLACNDTGAGYDTVTTGYSVVANGFAKKMVLDNGNIFLPTDASGSSSSYFADYTTVAAGPVISGFGGYYLSSLYSGVFCRNISIKPTATNAAGGSRLIYLSR